MSQSLDDHIARRLARRRKILCLTLKELGARTGADFRRLHKYEIGATRPTPAFLYELARALEVHVSYFYEGYIDQSDDTYSALQASLSSADRDLMNSFFRLDTAVRQPLETLIRQYASAQPGSVAIN
ncbi:MAG: helix-turn-helix transcriptional regulator [Henriciella sp.]|nr:helix-turn-helix transcriptional regulator [Henriciella sp.]